MSDRSLYFFHYYFTAGDTLSLFSLFFSLFIKAGGSGTARGSEIQHGLTVAGREGAALKSIMQRTFRNPGVSAA